MNRHDLVQGSAAWLAHRNTCWNASDAPAMLGCSPYETRGALIRRLATGIAPEVDAGTQRLYDTGHRFEALARPRAEVIVGDDLSPLSGSVDTGLSRPLAASFDGITFMGDTVFEHKTLNDSLRYTPWDEGNGLHLPLHFRAQMEHQLIVSGADRCLFMATKWDGETLVEERHCWYSSDAQLRAQILDGWAQLEKDVAAYVPTESAEPAKAEQLDHLPAVSVRLDGALSVAGNLPAFAEALKAFIERIPKKPATDNEFATCDAACKALKKAEEALDAAEAGALASITDVEAMRRAVADCRKLARDTRLAAEKLVERRKTEMKEQAVMAARRALEEHVAALNAELAPMRLQPVSADFANAIKGLRSIASMQDALDTALANGKIAADAQARGIRANVATFKANAAGFEFLFSDLGTIIHKAADDFATLVAARVEKHKADEARREAEQRERIRAEESARLEREQRAAAEAKAREEAASQARAEAEARAEVQRLADTQRQQQEAEARAMAREAIKTAEAIGLQPSAPAPAPEVRAFTAPPAAANEQPTLSLGEIKDRIQPLSIDAAGLERLGFPPTRARGACLYRHSDWPAIHAAMVKKLSAAGPQKQAA